MFNVNQAKINFDEELGSGASGSVYPYQKDADDQKWVIKQIHASNPNKLLEFLPEIVLGFSCDHPCIIQLQGYSIEKINERAYYIYLKYPRMKGTLGDKFREQEISKTPFNEKEVVKYFYSLICAVDYLHKKKIYHRDIKPGNVLLDNDGNAKLSDIGVAKFVGDEEKYDPLTGQGGTVDYTAPELLNKKANLTKNSLIAGDIWSLGLMMLELCAFEKKLFHPYSPQEEIQKIQKGLYDRIEGKYSKSLVDLIFKLIKFEASERIKIADIKKKLEEEFGGYLNLQRQHKGTTMNDDVFAEKNKVLLEKYKIKVQEALESVKILKNENKKLQNELNELKLEFFTIKSQPQMHSEISQYYKKTVEKLVASLKTPLKQQEESKKK